jgi:hypothetical protein
VKAPSRDPSDFDIANSAEPTLFHPEMWVNPKLATIQKSFPLYDIVMRGPAAHADEKGGLYFAELNPEIDVEKLTHFAMGIFWKASVHSWKGKERSPLIELGR